MSLAHLPTSGSSKVLYLNAVGLGTHCEPCSVPCRSSRSHGPPLSSHGRTVSKPTGAEYLASFQSTYMFAWQSEGSRRLQGANERVYTSALVWECVATRGSPFPFPAKSRRRAPVKATDKKQLNQYLIV